MHFDPDKLDPNQIDLDQVSNVNVALAFKHAQTVQRQFRTNTSILGHKINFMVNTCIGKQSREIEKTNGSW